MGATTPIIFTPVQQGELSYKFPTHEELMRKIIQNFNFLSQLVPIGSIMYIDVSRPGVEIPDPTIWQLCDGSKITDPDSPLASVGINDSFTPNLLSTFFRGAPDQINNPTGGSLVFNTTHAHGGNTGGGGEGNHDYDSGGDRRMSPNHGHAIQPDGSDTQTVDFPAHFRVMAFFKIV